MFFCISNLKFSLFLDLAWARGGAPRQGKERGPYAAAEGRVLREGLFQYVKGRSGRRPMLILRGQGGRVWEDGDCERFITYRFCDRKDTKKIAFVKSYGKLFS